MNFSTDRDLLVLEPGVFKEAPMISQQRLRVTDGELSGGALSSVSTDFASAQVDTGAVVLIDEVAHEVVSRTDASTVEVSLVRVRETDPAIPPADGVGLEVMARTFGPQAAVVHDLLLRLAGIDTDDPTSELTEEAVLSHQAMARLEALGTLELVYAAAAAVSGDNIEIRVKAERYRQLFNQALRETSVVVDLDNDGVGDVRRHFGMTWLKRV